MSRFPRDTRQWQVRVIFSAAKLQGIGKRVADRIQLGAFWLEWRTDRLQWAIAWYDKSIGNRRRRNLPYREHNDGVPPLEAQQALAAYMTRHSEPTRAQSNSEASVAQILAYWLRDEGSKRARGEAYGYAVKKLAPWVMGMTVDDLCPRETDKYIASRIESGVRGETIHSELAALKRSLKWAWENKMIPSVPFIGRVPATLRSDAKDIEFSIEQVASLLDVARSRADRTHVHLFIMIMLSTHCRVQALLELHYDQVKLAQNRIYFNASGRKQTHKKRPVAPIVPSLEPWLEGGSGKVIQYGPRPTRHIRTTFATCLKEAGIEGGSPNTLRHSCHTFLQSYGVPQGQIDAAAGHNEVGSGKSYSHLRPEYLKEFKEAIESYWLEMDNYTSAHRR